MDESGNQARLALQQDERGIPTRVTYPPTHRTEYYQKLWGTRPGEVHITETVSERIHTLSFHP